MTPRTVAAAAGSAAVDLGFASFTNIVAWEALMEIVEHDRPVQPDLSERHAYRYPLRSVADGTGRLQAGSKPRTTTAPDESSGAVSLAEGVPPMRRRHVIY